MIPIHFASKQQTLYLQTTLETDAWSTGPFAPPFARSLAPLIHSLAMHCPLRSLAHSLRSWGICPTKAMEWTRRFHTVSTHCAAGERQFLLHKTDNRRVASIEWIQVNKILFYWLWQLNFVETGEQNLEAELIVKFPFFFLSDRRTFMPLLLASVCPSSWSFNRKTLKRIIHRCKWQ